MSTILFTGGCRSGKSTLAQRWTEEASANRVYVATARGRCTVDKNGAANLDVEMQTRIARHRQLRGAGWCTVEADDVCPGRPLDAVKALQIATSRAEAVLFDCVTLWLADWLCNDADDGCILAQADALADWLGSTDNPTALVTNEVGWGLVPATPLGRRFRDMAGLVNQRLAAACDSVRLVACGLPLILK